MLLNRIKPIRALFEKARRVKAQRVPANTNQKPDAAPERGSQMVQRDQPRPVLRPAFGLRSSVDAGAYHARLARESRTANPELTRNAPRSLSAREAARKAFAKQRQDAAITRKRPKSYAR